MDIQEELVQLADENYQKFASKLLPGVENIIGVRLPILRKMAKRMVKEENTVILQENRCHFFEEIMLQGFVIGYVKEDIETVLKLVAAFVPKISNWSVCDSFCSSLKIAKEHKKEMWEFLRPYFQSEKEYEVRFAVVMLLNYYVEENYAEEALAILTNIQREEYYVKMAVAWAVSVYYISFPDRVKKILTEGRLDDFTHKKSIQKICESFRVTDSEKKMLRLSL